MCYHRRWTSTSSWVSLLKMFKMLKVKTADVFHLKLRVLFINLIKRKTLILRPIPRFQAIFVSFCFLLAVFEGGGYLGVYFQSNFTVGVTTTGTRSNTLVSSLSVSTVSLNTLWFTPAMQSISEKLCHQYQRITG